MSFHFFRKKSLYLDNAATTFLDPKVASFLKNKDEIYDYNSGAFYFPAKKLNKKLEESRSFVADYIKSTPSEVYFAPSVTVANYILITSIVKLANQKGFIKPHIISSNIEHSSINNYLRDLAEKGIIELSLVGFDEHGNFNYSDLENSLKTETVAVIIMKINNELGVIFDLDLVYKKIKIFKENSLNNWPILMSDYCQEVSNSWQIKKNSPEIILFNSHKIGGPKGLGFVYLEKNLKLPKVVIAGKQEKGLFPGTLNVKNIVAGVLAFRINRRKIAKNYYQKIKETKQEIIKEISKNFTDKVWVLDNEMISPHILPVFLKGVDSEVAVLTLSKLGIYVSSRSACKGDDNNESFSVLDSYFEKKIEIKEQLKNKELGFVRISFNRPLTRQEIKRLIKGIAKVIKFAI